MLAPEDRRKIIPLKDRIVAHFTEENWRELAIRTDCDQIIERHDRLLRSLHFSDPDYPGAVLSVLKQIVQYSSDNLAEIELYMSEKFPDSEMGMNVSSTVSKGPVLTFQPSVFEVPVDYSVDRTLVSLMMPFSAEFQDVSTVVKDVCNHAGLVCNRVDDIWHHSTVIQDVFSLILRSFIVVCDFTGKNPNVFYEAGIAHTLGKHVIPITQNADDIPFDLRHHRFLKYLNNGEGRYAMGEALLSRIETLIA